MSDECGFAQKAKSRPRQWVDGSSPTYKSCPAKNIARLPRLTIE